MTLLGVGDVVPGDRQLVMWGSVQAVIQPDGIYRAGFRTHATRSETDEAGVEYWVARETRLVWLGERLEAVS